MGANRIPRFSAHDERRAAVAAGCDPRTIRAYLDPDRRARMHSTTAGRIAEALRALGLVAPAAADMGTNDPAAA